MENRCIICGAIIPEGRLVCPNCEAGQKPEWKKDDNEQKATNNTLSEE